MAEPVKGKCPACGAMELVNVVADDQSCVEAEECMACGKSWWFQLPRLNINRVPGTDDSAEDDF